MSLLDFLTGGKTSEADDALKAAQANFGNIQTPTTEQLTLPQLQQYVNAGLMTPAQAQAYLVQSNAMTSATGNAPAREAEMTALSQLQDVATDNGMTPEMQAQLTAAINQANTNAQGQRGSILDQMAQRGIPTSLMGTAAQLAASGQDAQTANAAAAQAAGQAESNALAAISGAGNLGSNIEGQAFGEQAQTAAAQNAINQWNAQNQTQNSQFNAANQQQANQYNTQNAQNVSNANTQNANARTQYNAQVPETVFNNQIQKAQGQSGVATQQANTATQAGEQQAGLIGGILGGASQMGAAAAAPAPIYMLAAEGALVPGHPRVPGDSQKNDTVHAMLSPGEVVIPRSVAPHPEMAKQFIQHLLSQKRAAPLHPRTIDDMMSAINRHHTGEAA